MLNQCIKCNDEKQVALFIQHQRAVGWCETVAEAKANTFSEQCAERKFFLIRPQRESPVTASGYNRYYSSTHGGRCCETAVN